MKNLKIVSGMAAVFIILPMWFYILYQILEAINASELTWFLYWVYFPVSMLVTFVGRLLDE